MPQNFVENTRDETLRYLKHWDAFWEWDGHKHVAELASGKLSSFFANLTPLYSNIWLQERIGKALIHKAFFDDPRSLMESKNLWVIGPAMGAIGLAQSVAKAVSAYDPDVRCGYTEPVYEARTVTVGTMEVKKVGVALKRFDLGENPTVILVEDVTTTGGTIMRTREAIKREYPKATFCTSILSVIDRRSPEDEGIFYVKSLHRVHPKTWETVGDLPEAMKDCLPIRPKANWKKLAEEML